MERVGLTGETRSCDSHARKWCLRVFTIFIVAVTFLLMLFYSWGGVIFSDDPYILAYVNGCTNVSFGVQRVNDSSWALLVSTDVTWIPTPADGTFTWDGTHITLGCMSVLGIVT